MSAPISSIPSTPLTTLPPTTAGTGASSTPASSNQLDKDAFLKLLVAQLRYQDPSKPADSTQFLAQTAQFTQVEKLQELAGSISQLLSAQQLSGASALVGKTVNYLDKSGAATSGVVNAVNLGGKNPTLRVGGTDVPLGSVTAVTDGTAAGAASAAVAPPPSSTTPSNVPTTSSPDGSSGSPPTTA